MQKPERFSNSWILIFLETLLSLPYLQSMRNKNSPSCLSQNEAERPSIYISSKNIRTLLLKVPSIQSYFFFLCCLRKSFLKIYLNLRTNFFIEASKESSLRTFRSFEFCSVTTKIFGPFKKILSTTRGFTTLEVQDNNTVSCLLTELTCSKSG